MPGDICGALSHRNRVEGGDDKLDFPNEEQPGGLIVSGKVINCSPQIVDAIAELPESCVALSAQDAASESSAVIVIDVPSLLVIRRRRSANRTHSALCDEEQIDLLLGKPVARSGGGTGSRARNTRLVANVPFGGPMNRARVTVVLRAVRLGNRHDISSRLRH